VSIQNYIEKISQLYKSGIATEHSYRRDLQNLLESLLPDIVVTNEPRRKKCGAPDLILTRKNNSFDIGWIEAKDIGKNIDSKEYQEQFDRYKSALHNLIITDYLRFDFYGVSGNVVSINLARLDGKAIKALPENFDQFTNLIKDFANYVGESITSASQLSKNMAGKARLLANIIENALTHDDENDTDISPKDKKANIELKGQLESFKKELMHDITISEFADIYAQTIAYGMFTACLQYDSTPKDFSRENAAKNIPVTNPFLRKFFQYIAGFDLDTRLDWIVDSLAGIFRLVDTKKIRLAFNSNQQKDDPVIHFYETFLAEYNPKLRKSRGVWYTPEPVVNFIIRAVDDILKTEFHLKEGLANTEKINNYHKVQILDPATGTGTFLAAIVKYIYQRNFKGNQEGIWSAYVEQNLIPRLNGFEILMASYAMAHLKIGLLLDDTGFKSQLEQRLNIYLTNTLEKEHPDTGTLHTFARWLSEEANEANAIKRDTPVMVVIGNPPYAVSSSNKNDWIENLLKDYKKDLNEKNIQPLSDDYIKFIRYGSHFIEKNLTGILAYISNNSFIDGLIHRQMRNHLLETFDSIYILDLHGSNKRKETALDGSKDENVFDIMQGVSINLFIKTGKKQPQALAELYHFDLYGLREEKYQALLDNDIKSLKWTKIDCRAPEYFFIAKDIKVQKEYNKGFSVNALFPVTSSGIQTKRDELFIDFDKERLEKRISLLLSGKYDNKFINDYNIQDSSSYFLKRKISNCKYSSEYIKTIIYRPFDIRYIYYDKELLGRAFYNVIKHFIESNNVGLILKRSRLLGGVFHYRHTAICDTLCDINFLADQSFLFPLYLYPETENQHSTEETSHRIPNLDNTQIKKIARKLGLKFTHEKETKPNTFAPIDLLDYIYAVLHSPTYRETYKEFLKIDFPRVPYPEIENFWQLVELGGDLRQLHLLESPKLDQLITRYPMNGLNCITRKVNKNTFELNDSEKQLGQIWINDSQYFDQVPLVAWDFYVGGYQPVQKWLKDRQGRVLSFDDILHYQKVIKALTETDRIMKEIDLIMV
jgi:predicted helicase